MRTQTENTKHRVYEADNRVLLLAAAHPGLGPLWFAVLLTAVCCRAVRKSESDVPVVVGFSQLSVLTLAC